MEFFPSSLRILYVYIKLENTANKLGFYGKSLFLTHKYLGETGFAEFACVSPDPKKINLSLIDLAFASVVNLVIFRNSFSLYYLQKITQELKKIYPGIMTKLRLKLSPKPSIAEKKQEGKTGFVPVKARWVIERANSWMERCKSLSQKIDATLKNATAKINLCFIRLMLKRLVIA